MNQRHLPARTPGEVLTAVHYRWLAGGILLLAVYGSLIPFHFKPQSFDEALSIFLRIGLHNPADLGARGDWVVSIALFTTLSYLLTAAVAVDRPRWVGWCAALAVVPFCVALSVAIEFAQVYFPPRTVSLNDIVVESVGSLAGALAWLAGGQRLTGWCRRLGSATGLAGLARRLLPGYLALLFVIELMPFDFTVSGDELAVKYAEGKIWLLPFQWWPQGGALEWLGKALANGACFFPVGFLAALATRTSPVDRGWWPVVRLGLAVTAAIELLQLLVYTRFCDTTDVCTGTAAVCLGWSAGDVLLIRLRQVADRSGSPALGVGPWPAWHPLVWAGLFLAWLLVVAYFNWRPFDFTADPSRFTADSEDLPLYGWRRMTLLPIVDYYWGSKYQALDQFVKKAASFLPLGVLAALCLPRLFHPRAAWLTVLVALAVAVALETGQYFLPARAPSVTDVLIECSGAWLGFRLSRHIRVILWAETMFSGRMGTFRGTSIYEAQQ